jgi:hypothetical protein
MKELCGHGVAIPGLHSLRPLPGATFFRSMNRDSLTRTSALTLFSRRFIERAIRQSLAADGATTASQVVLLNSARMLIARRQLTASSDRSYTARRSMPTQGE